MDAVVPNNTGNFARHAALGNTAKISEAAVAKTHISQARGQLINQLAQKGAQDAIVQGATEQFSADASAQLEQPMIRSSDRPLTNKAQMLLMMGKYQAITNSMDDAQRASFLAIFATQSEARILKARELSEHIDSLHKQFDGLETELNSALSQEGEATGRVTTAERQLSDAQKALADLLQQLGVSDPDDPSIQDEPGVMQAKRDVADAQETLHRALAGQQTARLAVEQIRVAMQGVLDNINADTAEMNKRFAELDIPPKGNVMFSNAVEQSEKALTRTAMMIMIITEFIMKMEEAASEKLQNDLELNKIQQLARQTEMKRKSDEYEQQVKKAEDAQKMAGCIGKILGGVAIALGAVTTVFGGAGVALMAVGIALMVADPIAAALTGQSLTERLMNPLMEHVFMPLMNVLGDIVTALFDMTPLGLLLNAIDKATGANMMDTIHMVVTAAVTIAAIVAIALVAKSSAKFMIEKMTQALTSAIMQSIKQALAQAMNKVIPQVVNQTLKQGGAAVSRATQAAVRQVGKVTKDINKKLDDISERVSKNIAHILKPDDPQAVRNLGKIAINRIDMLKTGVQTSMPIVQSGMNINIANLRLNAAKALAAVDMASVDMSILRDLLKTILARFKHEQELTQVMNISLSNAMKNSADAHRFIVRNIQA